MNPKGYSLAIGDFFKTLSTAQKESNISLQTVITNILRDTVVGILSVIKNEISPSLPNIHESQNATRKAIILIPGLLCSQNSMYPLAQELYNNSYDVYICPIRNTLRTNTTAEIEQWTKVHVTI